MQWGTHKGDNGGTFGVEGGVQESTKTRLRCFLTTFSLQKSQRKKKISEQKSTEQEEQAETGHKKDIQGRANNIRKGRQGYGWVGPFVDDGLAYCVKATQKGIVLT